MSCWCGCWPHPNVLVTGRQGFLTHDALTNIATTCFETLGCWQLAGQPTPNELLAAPLPPVAVPA